MFFPARLTGNPAVLGEDDSIAVTLALDLDEPLVVKLHVQSP